MYNDDLLYGLLSINGLKFDKLTFDKFLSFLKIDLKLNPTIKV